MGMVGEVAVGKCEDCSSGHQAAEARERCEMPGLLDGTEASRCNIYAMLRWASVHFEADLLRPRPQIAARPNCTLREPETRQLERSPWPDMTPTIP